MRVVLASQSPRRRELLAAAGLDLVVRPADVDEAPWADELPEQTVLRLARAKAAVCLTPDAIVVAADTEVVLHGAVLGKPAGAAAAISMLTRMAGLEHEVITGFCVRAGAHERTGIVRTRVGFRPLSAEEIGRYVATGEPFDKAGGYGIQGQGAALVDQVVGSYTNVVGLPVPEVLAAIREIAELGNPSKTGS